MTPTKASPLCFPAGILDQHLAMLGKTGAGKSSALRHIVENLLSKKKRVCIIDPKGDWWGLKYSADGKSAGFPVIAFGDFKEEKATDVPLNAQSGKHVAELITSGNRPCIIGMRGWTQGAMIKFWIDFASTLFSKNAGELFLIGDEFHNFAPKQWKGQSDKETQVGVALHWSNRLLSEGRGLGLVCLIASQRPQKVHNDTLTSCETLVAMRVAHTADRKAVSAWIEGCGDSEQGNEVLKNLAQLVRGEAYVWSPEIGFGPKRLKFPMFTTFDSFAPPQLQKKISQKDWSTVDLAVVKDKLAKVIEEAEAKDPTKLQKKIVELERQLRSQKPVSVQSVKATIDPGMIAREVNQLREMDRKTAKLVHTYVSNCFAKVEEYIAKQKEQAELALAKIGLLVNAEKSISTKGATHVSGPALKPVAVTAAPAQSKTRVEMISHAQRLSRPAGDSSVGNSGLRRILIALAQCPDGLKDNQIGVRAGISVAGGTFRIYFKKGIDEGWIEGDRRLAKITDAGLMALGDYDPLPTGRDLYEYWMNDLGNSGAARILKVLYDAHPHSLTAEEVGVAANVESAGGTFRIYLKKLMTLELVTGDRKGLTATDTLFD